MIKNIKLFINDNLDSQRASEIIKSKLVKNNFFINEKVYDLAIAVGGDGAFLRMIKANNFDSDVLYVGVNSGTLGFLQEIKLDEIDKFIEELKTNKYQIEEIGIQETIVNHNNESSRFYSLNEIVVRNMDLKVAKLEIKIEDDLLERFIGDGILVASSSGSTAYNLSLGGSIVYNTFTSLQITPIAPINSKVYSSLINSVIIPNKKRIIISPIAEEKDLIVTVDGENNFYKNIENIETIIADKKIKCLRLSHYNFPQKINEKLLGNQK